MTRQAIVLFNLGGPDSPDAVEPFLCNLFSDSAIIGLPAMFRKPLARFISKKRGPKARGIYDQIGGKSPLLEETQAQAKKLEEKLAAGKERKIFICMRYWHPMSEEVAEQVLAYNPDEVLFLPLYPQYSTTTTASSFADLKKNFSGRLRAPIREICCYFEQEKFIAAHAETIRQSLDAARPTNPRLLFSAHGLPEKVIRAGDPYQWQVEQTVKKIFEQLALPEIDYAVCYQSRVGPLKWIGPATEDEIARAGQDGKDIVLIPVAFVSEHSETLVELDTEYRELATHYGVKNYIRVPTLRTNDLFIEALADLCENPICTRKCPATFDGCGCKG